jgi:aryl-alcohol dehydrogenase-like predicted oxidoreductase
MTLASSGRLAVGSVSEHDLAVARETLAVATELGVSPTRVALAWVRAQSPLIHPILSPRSPDQLNDCLGALDVELRDGMVSRVAAVSGFEPGFPSDLLAAAWTNTFV